MTLLFGILNQNKAEEPRHFRDAIIGGIPIPTPVVTAREAAEMRMEEVRRVLNRNNVPTHDLANVANNWDRAWFELRATGAYAQPEMYQANRG